MKFLADESVDFRLIHALRHDGIEIMSIHESAPSISDDEVLKKSREGNYVLITEDKDFGELAFRLKKTHSGVLLIRLSGVPIEIKIKSLLLVINQHGKNIEKRFAVLSQNKLRIR